MELQIGDILTGFCEGFFGRDSYGQKIVVAVGRDWVVVKEAQGFNFATGHRISTYLTQYLDQDFLA